MADAPFCIKVFQFREKTMKSSFLPVINQDDMSCQNPTLKKAQKRGLRVNSNYLNTTVFKHLKCMTCGLN